MYSVDSKFPHYRILFISLIIVIFLVACTSAPTPTMISKPASNFETIGATPSVTMSISTPQSPAEKPSVSSPIPITPQPVGGLIDIPFVAVSSPAKIPSTLAPEEWKSLPVIPSVSHTAQLIYQRGLEMGNDPHAFSKIGDCQNITTYFLAHFDMPGYYDLGPYSSLQETIDWYAGSFSRESLAVKGGFNAAAILSPLRADPTQCDSNENPVACEIRVHHPSLVIISLEEWWAGHPENYEKYMRQIIEYTIEKGVVPILTTKADNLEGNNLINQTIANLAHEYDIPLWNFWASVQSLPNNGLVEVNSLGEADMFHLTHSENYYFYNDADAEMSGWYMRNLTALQTLDSVRRGLVEQP